MQWAAQPSATNMSFPKFPGKAAAAEPIGLLSPTKQREIEPNFKAALSNNQKILEGEKKKGKGKKKQVLHTNE